jgi:hypothetical protein
MLIVLPFCQKDAALAIKVLRWAHHLDGHVPFKALLVHDGEVTPDGVRVAAETYFASVDIFKCSAWPGKHKQWPFPQNHCYQEVCSYIFAKQLKEPFLWWEPDATPLKAGWLKAIADEHAKGGKAYTGHIVGAPYGHLTGVAVYPWCVPVYSRQAMGATNIPWDLASKAEVVPHCHRANHLIQHIWERDGLPLSFKDKADVDAILSPTAVLFHRCKDGSLIDILNGEPFYKRLAIALADKVKDVTGKVGRLFASEETTAVVQLGRYGDIANALPAIRELGELRGRKPTVVVAKQFADILDGVTYADKDVFSGDFSQLQEGAEYARQKHKDVVVGQVWGKGLDVIQRTTSYNVDSWERMGMLERWGDKVPPTFDNRDRKRERAIITKHVPHNAKPLVLVSLTGGSTSKLDNGSAIKNAIFVEFGGSARIVDLDAIKFERVYDAIGLMEIADALVTSDTVWLHLANDAAVPTAAFLSDHGPWMQTETRCNCPLKLRGSGATEQSKLIEWISSRVKSAANRAFVHVCERHQPLPLRVRRAQTSWATLAEMYSWRIELMDEPYPRDSRMLGEERSIPFLRDVLECGLKKCAFDDYVVFTNDDTIIVPGAVPEMEMVMARTVALSSNRIEIPKWTGEAPNHAFTWHSGRDLMCFRASWLRAHLTDIPDYALGICDWDTGMAAQVRWLSGHEWRLSDSHRVTKDCELTIGLVCHEMHPPTWKKDGKPSHGTFHNRKLVQAWADKHEKGMVQGIDWLH